MQRFLGKLAPKIDPRTLMFAKYLSLAQLPSIPDTFDWSSKYSGAWGFMGNDRMGDCTCAAAGHMIMSWTAANGELVIPTDDQIIQAYSAISGYDPNTGQNDNGAVMINVLNYWRNVGIAGHKIGAYAKVNPTNIQEVKAAIYLFGGIYLGYALPISAQGQTEWTLANPTLTGAAEPGSWGGHAICGLGYDSKVQKVITWGETLIADWNFAGCYCDEAYAIISADFVSGVKAAPNGFDMDQLSQDLNLLQ